MSYSLSLEVNLGGPEPTTLDVWWNYTSNVAGMWRRAMPATDGLAGFEGLEAGVAAAVLRRAIVDMEREPEVYRAMDPPNGWGSFDGQLDALRELLAECERAPRAIVRVSR